MRVGALKVLAQVRAPLVPARATNAKLRVWRAGQRTMGAMHGKCAAYPAGRQLQYTTELLLASLAHQQLLDDVVHKCVAGGRPHGVVPGDESELRKADPKRATLRAENRLDLQQQGS